MPAKQGQPLDFQIPRMELSQDDVLPVNVEFMDARHEQTSGAVRLASLE